MAMLPPLYVLVVEDDADTAPNRPKNRKRNPLTRSASKMLFERAVKDRSKAFELKQELDRLGVFKDYEDRFLDLFKKAE
jgi:hypothetical protein